MADGMTKGEREELSKLLQAQLKLGQRVAEHQAAALLADAEEKLAARYSSEDARLRDITDEAKRAMADLDKKLAERCRELSIPPSFRPRVGFAWGDRGENMLKERRAELRKVAQTRIDDMKKHALVSIETHVLEARTRLAAGALTSEDAKNFLATLPDVKQLMPALDLTTLGPLALPRNLNGD